MTTTPPSGWNSFDSFGGYLHEEAAHRQLEAFAARLAPHGYRTFVVDIGWFGEYELRPGSLFPKPDTKHARAVRLDAYGRPLPSACYFPNGFGRLIDRTRELGLQFGVHIMRGIPRKAVQLRLPVEGAGGVTAADIADASSLCGWCHYNYGVDMSRPGAQAYYDSLVRMLAGWGVDFIKADDITGYPAEVEAVAEAIAKCGRPIVLSLSHGGEADTVHLPVYRRADMLRITKDIWDDSESIERSFHAWSYWSGHAEPGFWLDLDMIPFGDLQTMKPSPEPGAPAEEQMPALCGRGCRRRCELGLAERETFITQRALAASPLMVGGDLTTLGADDLRLLTEPRMLACNRNGVCGSMEYMRGDVQVWRTPHRTRPGAGWIGVFNRNPRRRPDVIRLTPDRLRLSARTRMHDIWRGRTLGELGSHPFIELPPGGCSFVEYSDALADPASPPPEPAAD